MKQVLGWWLPDSDTHFRDYFFAVSTEAGIKYLADGGRGLYQAFQQLMVQNRLYMKESRNGVAVDIGAHVGMWSWFLFSAFGRVMSFEPILENRECLMRNVLEAEIMPYACYDRCGVLWFSNPAPHNSGAWKPNDEKQGIRVRCLPLDSLLLSSVDFMKIDVQCNQDYVLRGSVGTIKRCSPVVCTEGDEGSEILTSLGYGEVGREQKDILWSK